MVTFVIGIIALLIAIPAIILGIKTKIPEPIEKEEGWNNRTVISNQDEIYFTKCAKKYSKIVGIVALVLAIVFCGMSCIYTQDVGEVKVIRNFGGAIEGTSTDAGIHFKAPWQDMITYDVRNNILSFMGDSEADQFEGGSANGSAVTINDASGTSATIDIQVNYSLDPQTAEELYADYGSQENFVKSICAVDIRAIPREVSGQFDTISILTTRGEFTNAVQEALTEKWKNYGLIVEQVSIQNVVYPDSIKTKYAEATAAEIAKQQALNEQETAKVEADTKVVQANGEAEANRVLAESLTDSVIQQNYIDALKEIGANGNLVVVPEGSTPMVNTGK